MSLRKAKVLYCISVIALALILAAKAGGIGEVAAIILLAGALPGWALVQKSFQQQFWHDVKAIIAPSDEQQPKGPPSVQE